MGEIGGAGCAHVRGEAHAAALTQCGPHRYDAAMLEVAREVPLPTLEELGGYLPSARFPSDHLPVVFDLRFRGEGASTSASGEGGHAGNGNRWPGA